MIFVDKKFNEEITLGLTGDFHLGSSGENPTLVRKTFKEFKKNGTYYIILGDGIEAAIPGSVGTEQFESEDLNTQIQKLSDIISICPELCLGYIEGNHELRLFKEVGYNVVKDICSRFNIDYLGSRAHFTIKSGYQNYRILVSHGAGSAKTFGGQLNKMLKGAERFDNLDIVAHGHYHVLNNVVIPKYDLSSEKGYRNVYYALCGSFMSPTRYLDLMQLSPDRLGYIEFVLSDVEHKIEVHEIELPTKMNYEIIGGV